MSSPSAADGPDSQEVSPGRRRVLLLGTIAFLIIALDLFTKILAVSNLVYGQPVRILGGLVHLSLLRNPGAAFGIATGYTWILTVIVTAVVVMIIRMASRLQSTAWAIGLGLVLGGAIGNLIDRLFRAPGFMSGHVVDFISVFGPYAEYFPVFNIADSAVTIGGITLVATALFGVDFDGRRVRGNQRPADQVAPEAPADSAADEPVAQPEQTDDSAKGRQDG